MNNKRFVDRSSKRGQILLKKKARAEAGGSATRSGLREIALRPGDPAMARAATSKVGLAAGLLGAAAWMLLPAHLVAQSCGAQNGIYTCNYSGTSTAHNLYTGSPDALPMVVNTSGNVVMSVQPGQGTGLNFGAFGENGSGGNVYGLQFNNTGSITLNYGSGWNLSPYGIQASLGGGSGNPGGLSESGSSPSGIHLVNSGAIALNMGGTLSGQGAGIWANEFGGAGENGGTGGWTSGVWVTNFAPITVDISSEGRIGGILAMTTGGDGSSDASTNTNGQGGPVGPASVESYAPVLVNFTWPSDATTNGGQFGILAAIQGGAGGGGNAQANGNWGGYAGATPSITLAAGADVTLNASGTGPSLPTPPVSGGVVALATGGAGGLGGNNVYGYNGGSGGGAFGGVINVTDAKVTTTGGYLPGLLVVAQGGVGGDGGAYNSNHEEAKAGFGGAGGNINAGATVNLNASSAGSAAVSTSGDDSPAIYVTLIGGDGGQGGYLSDGLDEGTAGYGGDGGSASPNDLNGNSIDITVSGGALSTQGDSAPGILAITQGGNGQDGQTGTDFTAVYGGNGGNGGGAGNVQVSVYGGSSITTQGDDAHGIVVQSVGGNAGAGGAGGGAAGHGGVGGTGGDTGSAQVNNGGSISTSGQTARGIIAQSLAGSGGGGGSNWSLFPGYGGKGLAGGAAGSANVSHDGWISTQGSNAQGVLLQSIAGGGGAGGDASGFMSSVGGSGALGGNGNSIYFQSTGGISTTGVSAHGVLGQSVGGGGGDGGGGSNSKVTIGGTGGGGGAGGAVVADLNAGTQITTAGMGATGVLMQAIGGGGGNAGNATSVGLFESISIGGQGGNGGNGGQVQVTATGANILTQGGTSPGIVAQSIGGGGGSGGQAISGSFSVGFSAGFAMGGSGATGGTGGPATVNVIGGSITTGLDPLLQANPSGPGACPSLPCNLLPADSYGVLVQSVGGGGGLGGSALAESAAVGVPVDGGSVSGTLDISLGGTGGSGQDAGPVFFGLSNGGQIFTSGSGSHGVLAQAIGGGGGAGGDSTSMGAAVGYGGGTADDDSVNYGVTLTFSMGGDGGTGGHGGNVLVAMGGTVPGFNNNPDYNSQSSTPDAPGSAPTSIVTYGDYSTAIVAQSVGGGGGNSGMGGGNTQGFGEATSTNIGLNLGSQGGAAGGGGYVAANLYSGSILTWGAGSMGLIAQSIAGGGGTSQGLSVNVAQSGKSGNTTIKPGINFALGGKGVPGQSGGAVDVYVGANIMTKGGDAPGVLAQSIAGGGGVGGSAAADGSNDNPILPQKATDATISALKAREASSNLHSLLNDGTPPTIDLTFGVTTGGTGGTGGDGGAVSIALTSSINTAGDWSKGLVAQSIGGGGGKGGSSAASGTGGLPEITLNLNHAIGGSGGASGNGANVSISLEGTPSIVTAGFGAAGAVGQSIGGGGGIGVDGSDQATGLISVGAGTQTGKSGAGGYGASVMFTTSGSYPSTIATTGGGADGVLLQSIGGGGGIGGAGSSLFQSAWATSQSLKLTLGGGDNANGTGGYASFDSSNGPIQISTTGYNSFGVLAQSIGGGGGVITSTQASSDLQTLLGGTATVGGSNGGDVYVNLANNSSITTTGVGAFGIAAQSIGGGGGVIRVVGDPANLPVLYTGASNSTSQTTPAPGAGGNVNVVVDGTSSVAVSGAGAIGVFAQSVTGGGGLIANEGGMFAGAPTQGQSCSHCGQGGDVTVTIDGTVSAIGKNGIGVFAQTAGANPGTASISVTGTVVGQTINNEPGPQSAAANTAPDMTALIQMDAPGSTSTLNIKSGGQVIAHSRNGIYGNAVQSLSGETTVQLQGMLTGQTLLRDGLLNIQSTGVHNTGAQTQAGKVVNAGTMNIGVPGWGAAMVTTLTGDYEQTSQGVLGVTVDSLNNTASHVKINGSAQLDGVIVPTSVTLLPGEVPVLTAASLDGMPDAQDSLVYRWDTKRSGNTLSITPTADFTPAGVALNQSQQSLAGYFDRSWNNADPGMAQHFAALSRASSGSGYSDMLNSLSSRATHAQSIALVNSAGTILGSSMSCPAFEGQSTLLREGNCVWGQVGGRWSDQDSSGETIGYDVSNTSYRVGVQHQIAPNWYLGGSAAIGQSWAHIRGGSSGDGDIYDGSITLKHIKGPWQVAGSLALASGSFDNHRQVSIPGVNERLDSDSDTFLAGARLRVGYEFAHDTWYVRPYGDVDLIYTDLKGFQESGDSPYALDVRGSHKTTVALSPMVEFGRRMDLDDKTTLRAYAAFGLRYTPNNTHRIDASFANATADNGTFTDRVRSPELLGKVDLGLQMFRAGGLEIKAGYSADFSSSFLSQSANIRLGYYF